MKVYLSVAAGVDTAAAKRLLDATGLTVLTGDAPHPGGRWIDDLVGRLRTCDAVVIVPFGGSADTVLIEAGAALGLNLPVVIFARDIQERAAVPLALRELPVITLGGNIRATAERLSTTLISSISSSSGAESVDTSPLSLRRPDMFNSMMERHAAQAFLQEGARVVPALRTPDGRSRVDFAASMPNLLAPAFDPVLVEVVGSPLKDTVDAVKQLHGYLRQLGLMLGMVVTSQDARPTWDIAVEHTAVVSIGLRQLQALPAGELGTLLSAGRNKLVHGVL